MAPGKSPLTPELAQRLHSAVGFLLAAGIVTVLCVTPLVLAAMAFAGEAFLFLLVPGLGLVFLVVGLAKLRGVTGEILANLGDAPRSASRKPTETAWPEPAASSSLQAPVEPAPARSAVEPPAAVYARQASVPVAKPAKKSVPAAPAIDWEEWVGQKLLQKVGIVIVLIGMLVLLQQAFENRWIDELGRVFLALVGSAVLLGAGEYFQKKYAQWSQGFTGGGLFLAYLSVWVAHVLYADALAVNYGLVIPAGFAFVLYAAITAVGALLAVRYNAQTIAWFSIAGGYLTPLLVDAAQPDPFVFSAYLGILAAGLLALTAFRHWQAIAVASFVLTQFYLASAVYPSPDVGNAAQAAIAIAFFALFASLPLLKHFRVREKSNAEDLLLIVGNAVAVYLPVQDALGGWQSEWVTLLCLALSAFTIVCSALALRTRSEDLVLGDTYLLGSIALIALALYHQLGWEWLALGWGPFATLVAYLALSLKRKAAWTASNLLLAGAAASLVTQMPVFTETEASWRPFLSNWSLQSYAFFASLLAMLPASRKVPADFSQGVNVEAFVHGLLVLLAFAVLTFEVTALQWQSSVPLSLAYIAFAAVAMFVFMATRQLVWFAAAVIVQIIVFIFAFLRGDGTGMDALELLSPFHSRFADLPIAHPWALVSVLSTLALVGLLAITMRGPEHPLLPRVKTRHLLLGMIVAQVWLHVSVEIQHVAGWLEWSDMNYHRALSAWWLLVGAAVAHVAWTPQWRNVAVVLLALPFAKDLLRIMGGDATMFDAIAWTAVALGVSAYGAVAKKRELLVAGTVGLLGTGAADMLTHFSANDAGLLRSVWWAIAGLLTMVGGFALKTKLLRQASIAIFAATVAKLLLVDFSTLETPVRIVASIATGLLLIGASYLYQRYGTPQGDR